MGSYSLLEYNSVKHRAQTLHYVARHQHINMFLQMSLWVLQHNNTILRIYFIVIYPMLIQTLPRCLENQIITRTIASLTKWKIDAAIRIHSP